MTNKENLKIEIGKRITLIRQDMMHMSKCEFAKLIGMKNQYLGAVEKGERGLTIEKAVKICNSCNVSSDYLLFGVENKLTENTKLKLNNYSDSEINTAFEILKNITLLLK